MKKLLQLLLTLALSGLVQASITPNQMLDIRIQGVPAGEQTRLNTMYQVDRAGYIEMWQLGRIKATGKSRSQLARDIANAYKARGIYTSPTFQVIAKDETTLVQKSFTVGGQVRSAGVKPFQDGMTIFEAIQSAGGKTAFGAMNRVKLHRNGKVTVLDMKNDRVKNTPLREGDTVEVPQKDWKGQ